MKAAAAILAAVMALPAAAQTVVTPPAPACAGETLTPQGCEASKGEIRKAQKAFARGLKAQKSGKTQEALEAFEHAADLLPRNVEYATAREIVRQQAVMEHIRRGDSLLVRGERVGASAEFRQALDLDRHNEYALQRLSDALAEELQRPTAEGPALVPESPLLAGPEELDLRPEAGKRRFEYRGDTRGLLEQIARGFGVSALFDDSVRSRRVRFVIDEVDFETAMSVAGQMTSTFWVPLGPKQMLIAADNSENRRAFDRMAMRTFYITEATTPQEVNELLNTIRIMFDVRYVSPSMTTRSITVRAPRRTLDLVTRLLAGVGGRKPQVMLHVQAYEANRSMLRALGIELPLQFQVFNIGAAALALTGRPDIQDIINELIATGAINQADAAAIQALIGQLLNQQQSIFTQPFATFGGGITLFGLSLPAVGVRAQYSRSRVERVDEVMLRTAHGDAATFRAGTRFPILNATFAPIFNTPDLSDVLRRGEFQTPFPSFTYEDLGLTMKVTPRVQHDDTVTLDFEMQIRALGASSLNTIPVIVNREFKTAMTLKNGEPAVIAGMMGKLERGAIRGIPGLANIPVLGLLGGTREKEEQETQLILLVTPYLVGMRERVAESEAIFTRDLPQPGTGR